MAHKSKKKHIKHRHEHERAAGAGPAAARTPSSRAKAAAKASSGARKKRGGLVRSIAKAAGKQLAAKRKRIVSRAKARVRAMLGDTGE